VAELIHGGDSLRNKSQSGFERPATEMSISTETAHSCHLESKIQLQFSLKASALGLREDAQDDLPTFLASEDTIEERVDFPLYSDRGREPCTEVDIRRSRSHSCLQQFHNIG
jgi:hypothetical protein